MKLNSVNILEMSFNVAHFRCMQMQMGSFLQHCNDLASKTNDNHWRRNLFGRHGNSRTTFEGGTAHNVKCRTTF